MSDVSVRMGIMRIGDVLKTEFGTGQRFVLDASIELEIEGCGRKGSRAWSCYQVWTNTI